MLLSSVDPRVADLLANKDRLELQECCRELGLSYQCQKTELAECIIATQVRSGARTPRVLANASGWTRQIELVRGGSGLLSALRPCATTYCRQYPLPANRASAYQLCGDAGRHAGVRAAAATTMRENPATFATLVDPLGGETAGNCIAHRALEGCLVTAGR